MLFYFSPFNSSKGPPIPALIPAGTLRILQWSANGISNKKADLKEFLVR